MVYAQQKGSKLRAPDVRKPALLLIFLSVVLAMAGCKEKNQYVAPPPPAVTVVHPVQKEVTDYLEFTGNTQAVASVEIRARVQGFLQSVNFKEGALVKKGDLLYIIEQPPYQAAVDKAAGDLEAKKAIYEKSEVEYQRQVRLMKENATSDRELNNAKGTRDAAKADVAMSAANLETSKINLGYTTIRSPINGRVGRNNVDAGNLVGAGQFTLLTTINQYDPIYAYFTLNEHDLLEFLKATREERKTAMEGYESGAVYLGLANEEGYPHKGRVDFADLGVDPSTGTMLLRGIFPNPHPASILPGFFVRLRCPMGTHAGALMVPERAIGVDQRGQYVLIVNQDNVVEQHPVKMGVLEGGLREITEGVQADSRVIVNGLQRARAGAKVNPAFADAATQAPNAAQTPAKHP